MDVHIHINGEILIVSADGEILKPPPDMVRFSPESMQLFGLTYLQQRLARIGVCPFCKSRGVFKTGRLDTLDFVRCWNCSKTMIVPDDLCDPFLQPTNSSRRNPAND